MTRWAILVWGVLWVATASAQTTTLKLNVPAPAAGDETIAILILSGEEAGIPLSELYSGARKVLEDRTALSVAALDTISLADRDAAIRDCAGRAACFAQKARMSAGSIGLLLAVSVDRVDEARILGLRLVDVQAGRELGAAGDEIPFGMSLVGALENQLEEVFPSTIWDQVGTIQIETTPTNAEVRLANRTCVSPCTLERMKPGRYTVLVRKPDHLDWSGEVALNARQTAEVRTTLEARDTGSLWSSPWLWGGVAVVVVGAVVGAVAVTQSGDDRLSVCLAPSEDLCPN